MSQSRLRLKNGKTIRNLKLTEISDNHVKFWTDKSEIEIRKSAVKWVETKRFVFQFDTGNLVWRANKCNDFGYRQVVTSAIKIQSDSNLKFKHFNYDSIAIGPCFRPNFNQKFNGVEPTVKLMHYHRLTPANQFLFPIGHLWVTGVAGTFAGLFGGLAGVFYSGVLVAEPRDIAAGYRIGAFLGAATGSTVLSYSVHGHANGLASVLGALTGVALAYSLDRPPNNLIYFKPFLPALCAFSLNEIVLWYKIHRHPHIRLWQIGSK